MDRCGWGLDVRDLNKNRIEFLLTDLETALTFMDVAATTSDKEVARRNHENARRAYDTVLRLMQNLEMDVAERNAIDGRLGLLKKRLNAVGQVFD